jgi:tRNA modification GTPase
VNPEPGSVFSTSDTIVAIATPPGRGGIGIVRLSGPAAIRIARSIITLDAGLEPRRATLTKVLREPAVRARQSAAGVPGSEPFDQPSDIAESRAPRAGREELDEVLATYFPGPASYTGDDVVELSAHGSPVVLKAIVSLAMSAGARLAEPGEFTLRAFLSGRMDLMQAEAVADLVDAVTPLQARAAFDQLQGTLTRAIGDIERELFDLIARLEASIDFADESYHFVEPEAVATAIDHLIEQTASLLADAHRGRLIREGLQVTIAGKPNVGKSSLFNALLGAARAIVTEIPGTTRDVLAEVVDLEGLRVTLLDTAGLRPAADRIELEGVDRARQALDVSDLILIVVDASKAMDDIDRDLIHVYEKKGVVVRNKIDIVDRVGGSGRAAAGREVEISALTGEGMDALRTAILSALDVEPRVDGPTITNVRHIGLVKRTHEALGRARGAIEAAGGSLSEEFILADLQEARSALEEVVGRRTPEELLAHIFSRFCIGK